MDVRVNRRMTLSAELDSYSADIVGHGVVGFLVLGSGITASASTQLVTAHIL